MFETAGAKRLVSVDLHSGQIQGFFNGPVDHLTAMPVLVDYMAGAWATTWWSCRPTPGG
jgi:ribose-phosphate pyrophosphokinase